MKFLLLHIDSGKIKILHKHDGFISYLKLKHYVMYANVQNSK